MRATGKPLDKPFGFATHDPLELDNISCQVVLVRYFLPGDTQHVFTRIPEDLAQAVVDLNPLPGRRRTHGDADEGKIEELTEQPVRVGLHLQLQGSTALSPKQQHHSAERDDG